MCTIGVSLVSDIMYESNPLLVCANLENLKLIRKDNMLDNYVLAFFFVCFFVFVSYIKYALLLLLAPFPSAIFIPGAGRLQ